MINSQQRSYQTTHPLCLLLLAWTLFLSSCALQKLPPVVPEQGGLTEPPGSSMEEDSLRQEPAPRPKGPGATLQKSADEALAAGRFSQAAIILERALRLEPRNPELWHMMAQVKSGQNNPAQSVQFCLKSNSLASDNPALTRRNWLLMEKSYQAMGQQEKADQARRKSRMGD